MTYVSQVLALCRALDQAIEVRVGRVGSASRRMGPGTVLLMGLEEPREQGDVIRTLNSFASKAGFKLNLKR